MRLEHLFDLAGRYPAGAGVGMTPYGGAEEVWYGHAEGTVGGERLSGAIRWLNHERARPDGVWLPHIHAAIETEDGAHVLATVDGYTRAAASGYVAATRWTFQAEHEPYRWLNEVVGAGELAIRAEEDGSYPFRGRVYALVAELDG